MPESETAILLLNGLPQRTQVALDGDNEAYLTNDHFAGLKGLAPGWHCLSWTLPSSEEALAGPAEGSVRNALLRWYQAEEVVVRELDRSQQRLVLPTDASSSNVGSASRRNITRTLTSSNSAHQSTQTIVSSEVEPRLLPVPPSIDVPWKAATRHLHHAQGATGRKVVAKILGTDPHTGDSATDNLAAGPSRARDAKEDASLSSNSHTGREEGGKIIWGKSRHETEGSNLQEYEASVDGEDDFDALMGGAGGETKKRKRQAEQAEDEGVQHDESLMFTAFDLRRSWPPNSVGTELTCWSEDKSWLLRDVAGRSRQGIPDDDAPHAALLCEFELAFVLFLMASNGYAWEQWKDVVTLFCRSSSMIGAGSAFSLHPADSTDASTAHVHESVQLDAHIAFIKALTSQLTLLPSDFWSSHTNHTQEQSLLKDLDVLRSNIARSLSSHADDAQQQALVAAWRSLSHSTTTRFGWQLDRRLDEEAEVEDDLEAEEGEDAPVIVEL